MARAILITILGLGCSLAAASPSLRGGQERRLDQAQQVPAEVAAMEAQVPDFQPATTSPDTAGLSANATEAAQVPANVSAAGTLLGAGPPYHCCGDLAAGTSRRTRPRCFRCL